LRSSVQCDRLELDATYYDAIEKNELTVLMARLKERFPAATDFGMRETSERVIRKGILSFGIDVKEVFAPASEKEIDEYQRKYEDWLQQCEKSLQDLHTTLQERETPPLFAFRASNDGARPAADALITIAAEGNFMILPPSSERDEDRKKQAAIKLESPPVAPRGSWKTVPNALSLFNDPNVLRAFAGIARPITPDYDLGPILRPYVPKPLDPNAFYYKDRPKAPVAEFSLECQQWRHGVEPELFIGQICYGADADVLKGALRCRIHAANAAEVATKTLPVRVRVKHVKASTRTHNLIEELVSRHRARAGENEGS